MLRRIAGDSLSGVANDANPIPAHAAMSVGIEQADTAVRATPELEFKDFALTVFSDGVPNVNTEQRSNTSYPLF